MESLKDVEEVVKKCFYDPVANCWTLRPEPIDDSERELDITRGYCFLCLKAQLVRELRLLRVAG